MARPCYTTSVDIDLDSLDTEDLFAYIRRNYTPEDVFPTPELEKWATDNGFVESAQEA